MRLKLKSNFDDNIIEEFLGPGSFGEAYKVRNTKTNNIYALKLLKDTATQEEINLFERENEILQRLKTFLHIIEPFTKVLAIGNDKYYLMECANTSLFEYHRKNNPLTDQEILRIFKEICKGLEHAHGKEVAHRDLHPGNILLKDEKGIYQVKLTDFGLAKDFTLTDISTIPNNRWGNFFIIPPEFHFKLWPTPTIKEFAPGDIYALGILLFYLYKGFPISHTFLMNANIIQFLSVNNVDVINDPHNIKSKAYDQWLTTLPSDYNNELKISLTNLTLTDTINNIIKGLCHPDYRKRNQTIEDLINKHNYLL